MFRRNISLRKHYRCFSSDVVSTLSIKDYDAVGFDVDHTLSKFKLPYSLGVLHDGFVKFLSDDRGWPKNLNEPFHLQKDFCNRGLVLDIKQGNFLKLSQDGYIQRCSHGTHFLDDKEISRCYRSDRKLSFADLLKNHIDNVKYGNFRIFDNAFDYFGIVAMARMIDITDAKSIKNSHYRPSCDDYRHIWEDAKAAYDQTFPWRDCKDTSGSFVSAYKLEPDKFINPCSSSVRQWLRDLKSSNIKLFILTSSAADFAMQTLEFLFGVDWHEYFDLVITRAGKPGFFHKGKQFVKVEGTMDAGTVSELQKGQVYAQGNVYDLNKFLRKETGKGVPKVLYFGDSIRSDIFPAKRYAGWDTVFILEEIYGEKLNKCTETNHNDDLESQYLTSNQWGSYFSDSRIPLLDTCQFRTFWSQVIQRYADVAVPTIDHIANSPIDHPFDKFDPEDPTKLGYYPSLPLILQ